MVPIRFVRRRAVILVALGCLAFASCEKPREDDVGSGVQATTTRVVPAFTRLSIGSVLEVKVTVGRDGPVELKGDDNLLAHVLSQVENGVLKLDADTKLKKRMPLEVRVFTARLEAVSASVASKLEIQGLSADGFEARAAGAGRVTAAGSAQRLVLAGKGASELDFSNVPAREATVRLEHASVARLGYVEKLGVTASGPSRIYHHGEPEIVERSLQKPARLIRATP
jgi:hypothetical protein